MATFSSQEVYLRLLFVLETEKFVYVNTNIIATPSHFHWKTRIFLINWHESILL